MPAAPECWRKHRFLRMSPNRHPGILYARHSLDIFHIACHLILTSNLQKRFQRCSSSKVGFAAQRAPVGECIWSEAELKCPDTGELTRSWIRMLYGSPTWALSLPVLESCSGWKGWKRGTKALFGEINSKSAQWSGKGVSATHQGCQRRGDCWRSGSNGWKTQRGTQGQCSFLSSVPGKWMSKDEQLPLQECANKVISSKETLVLIRWKVERPVNEEARNEEEFWVGHSLASPLLTV